MSKIIIRANYFPAHTNSIQPQNQHVHDPQQRDIANKATQVFFKIFLSNQNFAATIPSHSNTPLDLSLEDTKQNAFVVVVGIEKGQEFFYPINQSDPASLDIYRACTSVAEVMGILERDAHLFENESPSSARIDEEKHPTPPATPRNQVVDENDEVNDGEDEENFEIDAIDAASIPVSIPNALSVELESATPLDDANRTAHESACLRLQLEKCILKKASISKKIEKNTEALKENADLIQVLTNIPHAMEESEFETALNQLLTGILDPIDQEPEFDIALFQELVEGRELLAEERNTLTTQSEECIELETSLQQALEQADAQLDDGQLNMTLLSSLGVTIEDGQAERQDETPLATQVDERSIMLKINQLSAEIEANALALEFEAKTRALLNGQENHNRWSPDDEVRFTAETNALQTTRIQLEEELATLIPMLTTLSNGRHAAAVNDFLQSEESTRN